MRFWTSAQRHGEDEELTRWRAAFSAVTSVAALPPRQPGVCVGVVERIRLVPGRSLEVTVEDGTGMLTAVWTGRSTLPGLRLGLALRLAGTVVDERGRRIMRNPQWEMVTGPEV